MTAKLLAVAAAAALSLAACAVPAHAQSAAQYNQLNQAMQLCNSAAGALVPECAQLRGPQGAMNALGALGGMGGKEGQAAGIAGALMGALGRSNAAAAVQPQVPAGTNAIAAAYAACIQHAGLNPSALQACAQQVQGATAGSGLAGVDRNAASAMATYGAAGNYQACVAANPTNWQACLQQMGAAGNAGLVAAGVTPQQFQAAGLPVPQGYAPPAAYPAQPAPRAPADPMAGLFGR